MKILTFSVKMAIAPFDSPHQISTRSEEDDGVDDCMVGEEGRDRLVTEWMQEDDPSSGKRDNYKLVLSL